MATRYHMNFDGCIPFSDTGANILLSAAAETTWTVPGASKDKYRASFGCATGSQIWVSLNGTATVPIVDTATDTYNQEFLMPGMCRYVKGGDVLSFISTGTPQVGVSLLQYEA